MFTSGMELLTPSGRALCLASLLNTPCNRRRGTGVLDFAVFFCNAFLEVMGNHQTLREPLDTWTEEKTAEMLV